MTAHDRRELIRIKLSKALNELETIPAKHVGVLLSSDAKKLYEALNDLKTIESNLWRLGAQLRAKARHEEVTP